MHLTLYFDQMERKIGCIGWRLVQHRLKAYETCELRRNSKLFKYAVLWLA